MSAAAKGFPANSGATVQIGDSPPLSKEQLEAILWAAGHPDPNVAATWLMSGLTRQRVTPRTAVDAMNEMLVRELLSVVKRLLSPLQAEAFDALADWRGTADLAEALGCSQQHASNLARKLLDLGLVDRRGKLYRAIGASA